MTACRSRRNSSVRRCASRPVSTACSCGGLESGFQKPISAWDGAVARWRREGGDTIAEELQAEYEAVHGR